MKPKIKRIKHKKPADDIHYRGNLIEIFCAGSGQSITIESLKSGLSASKLFIPEAKELSKVLPKFLEEMER